MAYSVGEYFLSKYKVPDGILTCDHSMFELFSVALGVRGELQEV
jgi:hypothetical protein